MAQDIGDGIAIRKRRQWSSVPDDVLEDTRISLRARAVLGWMLGRPVGWTLYVRHMRRVLNMSEHVWVSIRTELEAAGYYSQTRGRDATGRIIWHREITDTPVSPSPNLSRMDVAMDGSAMHGNVGDIPISLEHDHLPPPSPPPRRGTR